jgi:hypothetical protein
VRLRWGSRPPLLCRTPPTSACLSCTTGSR